jgi:Carbohydrate esterase, sialic acid-specific acetylesterase/Secretion system C-terminal sorting domain
MKTLLLSSIFCMLSCSFAFGQITFTAIPMDSELVARDLNTGLGTYTISGMVNSVHTPYDTIGIKIYRDSKLVDSMYRGLYYKHDSALFNFSFHIRAELHEYSLLVYGIKNKLQILDTTINALVAGDVFIIEGQSNAFAMRRDAQITDTAGNALAGGNVFSTEGQPSLFAIQKNNEQNANINKNEYIRVFGNADSSEAGLLANLKWFRGEGNGGLKENGHAGQWGLRLGRLLIDSMKVPVAMMNGACGGTPISYYERGTNYKSNMNSNYARLYYRMTVTGLQNNVRAIMWDQGESDAANGTSTSAYADAFNTLQKSWKQDYPGFKKIYIFQTKTEEIEPLYNIIGIEEAERRVAVAGSPGIEIMSTSALKQDKEGLHFDYTGGYEEFGNRMYTLIARDIYGIPFNQEIDAPMIKDAYLSDSTTLVVVENAYSLLQHNPFLSLQTKSIQSYQIENAIAGTTIDSVFPYNNKIILKLSRFPGTGVKVSYLAPIYDTGTNWLTNTDGIDMVCFYQYPVADSIGLLRHVRNYTTPIVKVYPNPFHGYTNITLPVAGKYLVEVDNLKGGEIKSFKFTGAQYQLHLENLAKGIYTIRVHAKKAKAVVYSATIAVQ